MFHIKFIILKKYHYRGESWLGPYTIEQLKSLNLAPETEVWYPEICPEGIETPDECEHVKSILALLIPERKKTDLNLEIIGAREEGSFCLIQKMKDVNENQVYAKKQLRKKHFSNEEYNNRLKREILILNKLQGCENIIELIDCGYAEKKPTPWYIMPYADSNLYTYIKRNNANMSLKNRIDIFKQILFAIKYAHNKGVSHRDISPANILLFETQDEVKIKVCDFGLGKTREELLLLTNSSAKGYGQILYVSPEQREKLKLGNEKSDIYSLGNLLYFVFTGKDPLNIKLFDFTSVLKKATNDEPGERHENIEEFESDFIRMCEILIGNKTIPIEYITLKDLISSKNINWNEFNEIAIRGIYNEHVFHDYISPILRLFSNLENIRTYCGLVRGSIVEFLKTFISRMHECLSTTRWDFRETNEFGKTILKFYETIASDEGKLLCINFLWHLGFVSDQWSVQRDFIKALKSLPKVLEPQLSEYIIINPSNVDLGLFSNTEVPLQVKLAIIEGNEKVKAEKKKAKDSNINEWF